MGIDNLNNVERSNISNKSNNRQTGETIRNVDRAIEVMREMRDILNEWPTQKQWNKLRDEVNVSTKASTFNKYLGYTFAEVREMAGGDKAINSEDDAINYMQDMIDYIGKTPTVKEWDKNKDDLNITTPARHFKSNCDKTFGEIKEEVTDVRKKIRLTEDMKKQSAAKAYIVGVILGDGNVGERNILNKKASAKVIQLNTKDRDFAEEYARQICEWTGLQWDGWYSDDTKIGCYGPIEHKDEKNDQWHIAKGITEAYEHLMQYQEAEKDEILELRDEFNKYKIDLLRGLWDSEGHIQKHQGTVGFTNANEYICLLYMYLINDVININLVNPLENDGKELDSSKKYGEFRVTEVLDWGARQVYIPDRYTGKFYETVNPTIERKREVFEKYKNR